jgi:ribonuclease-3
LTREPKVLLKKLGLQFNDVALFSVALTHRSAGEKNNERLEFLGDAVLGFVIADVLWKQFPKASEGDLSRLRASLVNQTTLAEIARELHLGDYLIMGSGELKSGGFRRDSILSDAVESIMGAILTDQGFTGCRAWVLSIFSERLSQLSTENWQKDPKTRLQEHLQARQLELPVYQLLAESGQPHVKHFTIECRVCLIEEPVTGAGTSRKKAEQEAAEQMLKRISKSTGMQL